MAQIIQRILAATLSAAALGAAACLAGCGGEGDQTQDHAAGEAAVTIGGPFSLINQDGERVTDEDLLGRPFLVFFGYAYCPDVCPLTLNKLSLALDMLGPDAETFQTVMISIDPERDTPELLSQYVGNHGFPKNLMGLTGTAEEIEEAATAYRVYYKKSESTDTTAGYLMEHSSVLYLMDADGRFADVFSHASTPAEIAEKLRRHLDEHGA